MSDKVTLLYCIREVSALNFFETHYSITTRPLLDQYNLRPELSNPPLISHLTMDDI
jgi:hypothetical protein